MRHNIRRERIEGIVEHLSFSSVFAAVAGVMVATPSASFVAAFAYGASMVTLATAGFLASKVSSTAQQDERREPRHMDPEYQGADNNFLSGVGLFGAIANTSLAGLHGYAAEGISAPAAFAAVSAISGGVACRLGAKLLKGAHDEPVQEARIPAGDKSPKRHISGP